MSVPSADQPASDPVRAEFRAALAGGLEIIAVRALGNVDEAQDAVQETLSQALTAIRTGRVPPDVPIEAFVYGILRHVITDVHRRRAREGAMAVDPITLHAPDPSPLGALIAHEEREVESRALAELPAASTATRRSRSSRPRGLSPCSLRRSWHRGRCRCRRKPKWTPRMPIQTRRWYGGSHQSSGHFLGARCPSTTGVFVVALEEARALDWASIRTLPLAVEILSPSSRSADRSTKRRLYQDRRVATYWMIDGDEHCVEVWGPDAEFPDVERDLVSWYPAGASRPFTLALGDLSRLI